MFRVIVAEMPCDIPVYIVNDGEPTLVMSDDSDGQNEQFVARQVARNIAQALKVKAELAYIPVEVSEPADWTYSDIGEYIKKAIKEKKLHTVEL